MIESIKEIKNFKSIENLSSLDLTPITLIGGKSNCGKTNLLEALFLLHDRQNANMTARLLGIRGMAEASIEPESLFAPFFTDFDMNREIVISIKRDKLPEIFKIKYNPNYMVQLRNNSINTIITGKKMISTFALDLLYDRSGKSKETSHLFTSSSGIGLDMDYSGSKLMNVIYLNSRIRTHEKEEVERFSKLDLKNKQNIIIEFMQLLEPRLRSISVGVIGGNTTLFCDLGLERKIPIIAMGDGLYRLLQISLAIADSDGLVFIDEIENGIHFSAISKLWYGIIKLSEKFNCQLIITTHSYECISEACNVFKDNDKFSYVRLDKSNDNRTIPKVFTLDNLKTAVENEMEVR